MPATRIEYINKKIQFGQGRAASVIGQTYNVRRLDNKTNVSVSGNKPVLADFPISIRDIRKREAIEGISFDLNAFIGVCDTTKLLAIIQSSQGYGITSVQIQETGYEAYGSGIYSLARVRPTQETIFIRTEFTASITRPYPTAGAASSTPVTPGTWVEGKGYGGTPKANELVMTLNNGLYSFQAEGATMATVQVGIVQNKRIKEDNQLKTPMRLPGGEFVCYIPDVPGVILRRNDRINSSDRFEIMSFFNSEDTGLSGNVCIVRMMGV